jgi:hypothetical protein
MADLVPATRFTDEFLDELRTIGDPEADQLVASFFARVGIDADGDGLDDRTGRPVDAVFQAMLRSPVGSEDHDPPIVEFVTRPTPLPEWADPEKMRVGQELFWTFAPQFGLGLWMASIPSGYAGARDAIVLGESVNCVSHAKSRFLETGQFVIDVMHEHGLVDRVDPTLAGGIGLRDIRHVRLIHAMARYLIKERDDLTSPDFTWTPAMGEPVNQMALLATMFTFCVVGLESLETFGVRLTPDEQEAYVHLWNVIGHLMGIRDDVLPIDVATSQFVWNRIKEREYATSPQGRALTHAAITVMQELMPTRFFDGFPATGIRALIGKDAADLLGVPRANWTRTLLVPGRVMNRMAASVNRDVRAGRHVSQWMGRVVFTKFLELEGSRQGLRQAFEIDDALRRRLVTKRAARRLPSA